MNGTPAMMALEAWLSFNKPMTAAFSEISSRMLDQMSRANSEMIGFIHRRINEDFAILSGSWNADHAGRDVSLFGLRADRPTAVSVGITSTSHASIRSSRKEATSCREIARGRGGSGFAALESLASFRPRWTRSPEHTGLGAGPRRTHNPAYSFCNARYGAAHVARGEHNEGDDRQRDEEE